MGTFDLVLRFSFSSGNGVWRYCASVFKTDAPFSVIAYSANPDGLFATLTNVRIVDESGAAYLTANRRGTIIKERLLPQYRQPPSFFLPDQPPCRNLHQTSLFRCRTLSSTSFLPQPTETKRWASRITACPSLISVMNLMISPFSRRP